MERKLSEYAALSFSGSRNDENEININEINTDLSAYQNQDDETFKEAVHRVLAQFQGKFVNTVIGKVLFNAVSTGELKLGTKENKIRAALIPFVPQTLQKGEYLGKFNLTKNRVGKKAAFVAFHNFRNTVVIDNQEIDHVVKVGERENGEFVFVAYHSRAVFDSTHEKTPIATPDTVSNIKAGRSEVATSVADILQENVNHVNAVLDDISDGKDGWNIEIISIRDLGDVSGSINDEKHQFKYELGQCFKHTAFGLEYCLIIARRLFVSAKEFNHRKTEEYQFLDKFSNFGFHNNLSPKIIHPHSEYSTLDIVPLQKYVEQKQKFISGNKTAAEYSANYFKQPHIKEIYHEHKTKFEAQGYEVMPLDDLIRLLENAQ